MNKIFWQSGCLFQPLLAVGLASHATMAQSGQRVEVPSSRASGFQDCADCPSMIVIPSGSFIMGTDPRDRLGDSLEQPARRVRVARFAAGRFDVTKGEWTAFVRATRRPVVLGCQWTGRSGPTIDRRSSWQDLGFAQTARDPVVCVTWQDAKDYARWLSRRTGKPYRLLTEAEWEYAARAGTSGSYYWGNGRSHDFANHGTETCCGGAVARRDRWMNTSPGGVFPPNAFGLYDMSGNVMQWVEDCFSPTYAGLAKDGSAFRTSVVFAEAGDLKDLNGTSTCDYRVARGGDWGNQSRWIRPAARSFAPPPGPGPTLVNYRSGGVGFRVASPLGGSRR